jgi:uncharacterized protein YggT (Ycf19 family)
MCEQLLSVISYIDWSELIKVLGAIITAIAAVSTVIIARNGLNTWKQQLKTKQKTDLLDNLTTALHDLLNELSAPITHIEEVKTGLSRFNSKANGHDDIIAFFNEFDRCKEKLPVFETLINKVAMFDFVNLDKCLNVYEEVVLQHEKIESVARAIIENLEHHGGNQISDAINAIDIEDMKNILHEEHANFSEFITSNYKIMYK